MSAWDIDPQEARRIREAKKRVGILSTPRSCSLPITHYLCSSLSVVRRRNCFGFHRIPSHQPVPPRRNPSSIQEPKTRERKEKATLLYSYTSFAHPSRSSAQRSDRRNPHTRHRPDACSSQQKPSKQHAASAASAPSRANRMLRANCHGWHHRCCSVCYSRHPHRGENRKRENPKHRPRSSSSHCGNPSPLQTHATVHAMAMVMVMAGPSTSSPSPPTPPCPYFPTRQSCRTHHCSSWRSCDYPASPTA